MKLLGFGGFALSSYWNSTGHYSTSARSQSFSSGATITDTKAAAYYVRAVRSF